jgi:hypothetical protein
MNGHRVQETSRHVYSEMLYTHATYSELWVLKVKEVHFSRTQDMIYQEPYREY